MSALLFFIRNPMIGLCVALGIVAAVALGYGYVRGVQLNAALSEAAVLRTENDRLKMEAKRLDEALTAKAAEVEAAEKRAKSVRTAIDKYRNTADDQELDPMTRAYIEELRK